MRLKAVLGIVLILLLIGMLMLAFDFARVQTPATEWTRSYGGDNFDRGQSAVETGDGGYALAGYTGSFGAGGRDFWLVKATNPPRIPLWTQWWFWRIVIVAIIGLAGAVYFWKKRKEPTQTIPQFP